jgi:hypothetical protein
MGARRVMTYGYAQPFSFTIGARPRLTVTGVRHGVTQIALSDGRLVRATLHVKGVSPNPKNRGILEISYDIVTEVLNRSEAIILDVHETLQ